MRGYFASLSSSLPIPITASGTMTAWIARPMKPVRICAHIIDTVKGVPEPKSATEAMKNALPQSSAAITAGNATHERLSICFENIPEISANTASSAIMKGSLAAAGIALPAAEVMRKLMSGESIPAATPQRQPRIQPPSSTGRYIGRSIIPACAPTARCASCGRATARTTMLRDTRLLTVIFVRSEACLFVSAVSIMILTPLLVEIL